MPALRDLFLEVAGPPLGDGIEVAVFVDAANLARQGLDELLILFSETLAFIPDQTDPAVDVRG